MRTFASPRPTRGATRTRRRHLPPARRLAASSRRAEIRRVLDGERLQPEPTLGSPGDVYEREAGRVADAVLPRPQPGEVVQRLRAEGEGLPAGSPTHFVPQGGNIVQRANGGTPSVTNVAFVNAGNSHADNCCPTCPVTLGVGRSGTGSNGMELQFTLSGHRAGFSYDIVRTRRNSMWEQRAGAWTRVESQPMGTGDDHHNDDECLRPVNNRIFVTDTPGANANLPLAAGTTFSGLTGASTHADATDVVIRLSFAEWVITRNRGEGVPWTTISPGPFTFWHSTTWLTRNGANQWVLDAGHSEIEQGSLSAAVINAEPVP